MVPIKLIVAEIQAQEAAARLLKNNKYDALKLEVSFWFEEFMRLWNEGDMEEADDARQIYLKLSKELAEMLFG